MVFLISLIVAAALAFALHKVLLKHGTVFYILAAVICAVLSVISTSSAPQWINQYVFDLFRRGALGTALFVVVMYIGTLKNGSACMKKLMPVRGHLSILASVMCLCHNIFYGRTYFVKMFTSGLKMPANQFAAGCITIVLLIIMLPLFIMSFPKVRRAMKPKTWKKYQRFAYVFYGLLYVHIMLLMVPFAMRGMWKYSLSITVYSLVFGLYAILRLKKAKIKASVKRPGQIVCGIIALLMIIFAWIAGGIFAEPEEEDDLPLPAPTAGAVADTKEGAETPDASAQPAEEEKVLHDGEFTGVGTGYAGKIEVFVTIENGQITNIELGENGEDGPYLHQATAIFDDMLEQQTYAVDAISGATSSSVGIKSAVKKALAASMEAQD